MVGYPSPNSPLIPGQAVPSSRAWIVRRWPEVDIATLMVPGAGHPPLAWETRDVIPGEDVGAAGFPFALDLASRTLAVRVLRGHVVCSRELVRFPARPACYETSFATPRGLSGAALLRGEAVVGCVIGNESMGMEVFNSEEQLDEGGVVTRVVRWEGLNVGVAIQARVILALRLDERRTLRDYLAEFGGRISE